MQEIIKITKGAFRNKNEIPYIESDAFPGFQRKVFSTKNIMMTVVNAKSGAKGKPHTHEAEQIMYFQEGKVRFTVEDETKELAPGDIVGVASNVPHSIEVIEDSKYIEIFHPIRLDLFLGYI